MQRHASAIWQGTIREGKGQLYTESKSLSAMPYSYKMRFEDEMTGTNPEELIGAAHAGCFSMALAGELQKLSLQPETIETRANVSLDRQGQDWSVTAVHLEVSARVPGADQGRFMQAAEAAKAGCPISKLLKANITMNAMLDSADANLRQEMTY